MTLTIRERLVRGYANQIYWDYNRTYASTNPSYHAEIKVYAAANFTDAEILGSFNAGCTTQAEYEEVIALKYPVEVEPPVTPPVDKPTENPVEP